jgi:hypothetical protein
VLAGHPRPERDVREPVRDQHAELAGGRHPGRDLHRPGEPAAERLKERPRHELSEGRGGDDTQLLGRALRGAHGGMRLGAEDDDLGRGAEQPRPSWRQRHAGLAPGDQLIAEVLAKGGDRLRDGGLADAERDGRGPYRAKAGHQDKRVQLRQGQGDVASF